MKKILSVIIALSMIVSASAVFAADAVAEETATYTYDAKAYSDAHNLMTSLLGSELFASDPVAEVTRAEFVAATCIMFNTSPISEAPKYDDVKKDSTYAGYIAAANAAGWISDASKFNPNDKITLAQATKIILTAAEYSVMADAKGGFPTGYLSVANSIDLFEYVDTANAEKVTVADASIMFYNLMLAPVFEVISYGDKMDYAKGSRNYLQKLYEAYPIEGTITATEHSSLLYNAPLNIDSNTVAIDGVEYKYPDAGIELLGKKVTAYIDAETAHSGTKEILCIIEDAKNEELKIIARDYISTNGTQFFYDKDGKQAKAKLDSAYKVIYNGRRVSDNIMPSMLYDDFATIRLLNSDGDSSYEVIFIDAYTYLRVANVDYLTGYISFDDNTDRQSYVAKDSKGKEDAYARANSNKFIDLSTNKDVLCTIYNQLGEKVEMYEITNDIIVGLKSSADHLVHEIVICPRETVSGVVGIYDSENGVISVDGTAYTMSKDFWNKNFIKDEYIKLGDKITAYKGINGELVYLVNTQSEFLYGLVSNAKIEKGLKDKLIVEIFTNEGFKVFETADKVSYDSNPKTNNKTTILDLLNKAAWGDSNIIKYSLNKDGLITHIDFSKDESKNEDYDPSEPKSAYDSLTKVFAKKQANYRPAVSGLVGTVVLSEASIIVDLDPNLEKGLSKEDRYLYTNSGKFENNYSYTMDIYDMDENGYAGFAYVTSGPTDSSRSASLKTYIIEKSMVGMTDEYKGYMITCYGNGSYGTYFLPEKSLGANIQGRKRQPKPGDLIRFTLEKDNIIDEYYVDFYCELDIGDESTRMYKKIIGNGVSHTFFNNAAGLPDGVDCTNIVFANNGYTDTQMADKNGSSGAGYMTGYVYNSERTMVLCNGNDTGKYAFKDFRPYLLPSTVILFDTQARKVMVTPYMTSAVKTYKANPGEEDFVVLRNNSGKPEVAFIYR